METKENFKRSLFLTMSPERDIRLVNRTLSECVVDKAIHENVQKISKTEIKNFLFFLHIPFFPKS